VNVWNSLPNSVVDVDTVDLFKERLDNNNKFWLHHDTLHYIEYLQLIRGRF